MAPPDGYHSLTQRIFVDDVDALIEFLRRAFLADGEVIPGRPVELRIGDSTLLISSTEVRDAFPAFLYVYCADADTTYRRAVEAGAITLEEPLDTPYGDRRAMVEDPFGNVYQIAHRLPA